MITGWVKNILYSILPRVGETIGQGAQAFEKKAKVKLIDVAEGAYLTDEARKKSLELLARVRKEGSPIERLRFSLVSRRKVKKNMADFYDIPEILDEVTEKIREVADNDPFYKKLLG